MLKVVYNKYTGNIQGVPKRSRQTLTIDATYQNKA